VFIDEVLLNASWCILSANISHCRLVIETLEPLPRDRKCFRMVNGVLVERTIKDVIPSLKTNADGLKQVLDELLKQYKAKQNEMDTWKVS
jgi:prefoldin subunit 2